LEAAKREFIDLPPLRSAQFALVGPATGEIMVRLSMRRRGKSTAFVSADLFGEDGLATRATFCFTGPRPSAYKFATDAMPEVKRPEQSTPFSRKVNFAQLRRWSVQPCVWPICAVHMTAGHNALRGSGRGQKHAFEDAMALVGYPDRRIDRHCIRCCSPSNHYDTPGYPV
jgi:hypothetical protein